MTADPEWGDVEWFRVIVCGSRGWTDRKVIADRLNDLVLHHGLRFPNPVIVHGHCRTGADRLCHEEAQKAGMLVETHPAEWKRNGRSYDPGAGFRRNERMAQLGARLCIAFWDGRSTGTWDMIERALRHSIPVEVIRR